MTARRLLIAVAAWAVGAAVFFHDQVLSGFRWLGGDLGDARLGVFLVEHWRHVLAGAGDWLTPPYFHPTPRTLAFTDAAFGLALPYVPLRWLGLDELLAFQLTVIALSLASVLGFVALAMSALRIPFAIALPAALGFTFANMNYVKTAPHPVYALVWVLPVLALCAVRALAALPTGLAAAAAWGAAGAALLGLIAFTTFQVAWYAAVLATVAGLAFAALEPARLRGALAAVGARRLAAFAAIATAALALAFAPFVVLYLPVLLAGAERPYGLINFFAPRPDKLLDLGGGNLMWGWLARAIGSRTPEHMGPEWSLAQTPVVAVVCGATVVWLWRRRRAGSGDARVAMLLAAGVAVAVILPLLVRVGTVSLWQGVWAIVPGARAIRTPFRFQLVLAFPVWLIVAYGAMQLHAWLTARSSRARATAAVAALLALALAEQVNLAPVARIDRSSELARLAPIGPPPASCGAFYVRSQEPRGIALQTDAMMVAARHGIATVHGISGTVPADWDGRLEVPDRADYRAAVAGWAAAHGIAPTLCALELPEGRWVPPGG